MLETEGLSAQELFRKTFELFMEREDRGEICFPATVRVDVMDRIYPHGTKIGDMHYESAQVIYCAGKAWAMSLGKCPRGDDLAVICSCDMMVIPLPPNKKKDQRCRDVVKGIAHADWFRDSFIQAKDDGELAVWEGGAFSKKIARFLRPNIKTFVLASKPAFVYKTEFAVVLHDVILTVLNTAGKW